MPDIYYLLEKCCASPYIGVATNKKKQKKKITHENINILLSIQKHSLLCIIWIFIFLQLRSSGWKTERLLSHSIIWKANWICGPLDSKID
jgi:hypothetical protein